MKIEIAAIQEELVTYLDQSSSSCRPHRSKRTLSEAEAEAPSETQNRTDAVLDMSVRVHYMPMSFVNVFYRLSLITLVDRGVLILRHQERSLLKDLLKEATQH